MPYQPQYGATNGVAELDLGQEGSPRRAGDKAIYLVRMIVGEPEFREVENPLTQQMVVVVDHLGFLGQPFGWAGRLKVDGDDTLGAIESELHAAKTGHAMLDGVFAPFDSVKIKATRLANAEGRVVSEKARLKRFKFGKRTTITTPGSAMTIALPLTILFEGLG